MGDTIAFQQMGFGVALALLIDATIVRSVLVPATMKLLGERNWYLPAWLTWLPDVHVEGASHGWGLRFGRSPAEASTDETCADERVPGGSSAVRSPQANFYTVLAVWISLSLMWLAIDLLDDSSSFWFYWPMLGTGIGVAITGIVLLGIGGLFGADWERRQIDQYLRRRGDEPASSRDVAAWRRTTTVPRGRMLGRDL